MKKFGDYHLPEGATSGSHEFDEFLEDRINSLKPAEYSNCFGTGLYIVGENNKDEYVGSEIEYILENLQLDDNPKVGFLVGWHNMNNTFYTHLGVITGANPLLVTNRHGFQGPLAINEPFMKTNGVYNGCLPYKGIKYFVPRRLQELLSR